MTTATQTQPAAETVAEEQQASLLDQAVSATRFTERSRAKELIKTLTDEALSGSIVFTKNLTKTVNDAVAAIDKKVSDQLATILHEKELQKLEGSWRGLHYLVSNTLCSTGLKIKLLNSSKKEIHKDLDKALEFDQSQLFKKIYESEFGTPGGEPYGLLVGDYEFSNHPEDIEFLTKVSGVAAASFAPFLAAAESKLLGFDSWEELSKPRDLEKIFDSVEYATWNGYRENQDSRFVTLTMPRVLSRLPYGANTKPVEEFSFEEVELDHDGKAKPVPHDNYTWMNAAYVMATRMTNAYSEYGWCTAIRGAEGGGKVTGLPTHIFKADDGDVDIKCPTEIAITDRREAELSKLGLLPLCHYKKTDYSVFFGAQTTQKAKEYDDYDATANAAISARLPYLMVASRISHHLKIMARDKIGSMMEVTDVQDLLNRWIAKYINLNPDSGPAMKYRYPLAEAKIKLEEVPGRPGSYRCISWMRPWLQLEELTTSLRLVANVPSGA